MSNRRNAQPKTNSAQRRAQADAAIAEGLRRLKAKGCTCRPKPEVGRKVGTRHLELIWHHEPTCVLVLGQIGLDR